MADPKQQGERTVGLLAGSGLFPICFARGARAHGVRIVAIAIEGEASPELAAHVDEIHWTGLARLGQWIRIFKQAGVKHAVMCGAVRKAAMYPNPSRLLPDLRSAKLWYKKLRSREDHTLLGAVAEEFEREGIKLESSVLYCPELLASPGCLTSRKPTRREWSDIRFAWPAVKQIAAMQIGQTVVVKDGAVIAVEAMEGTDEALRRGGKIARRGAVAVKVAKEGHDERFDIPCIGPDTVDVLVETRISVLAVEAGKTIVLEKDEVARKANRAKVTIVALTGQDIQRCSEG